MTTINKVLETLSRLKPNTVKDEDIARWLLELDGQLFKELYMPEDTIRPQKWPEDGDLELTASAPYDCLYEYYTLAQIEFYQREYGNYNNTMELFNDALDNYRRAYRRDHLPPEIYIHNL